MRLDDLAPELIRWEDRVPTSEEAARYGIVNPNPPIARTFLPKVSDLADAQGVEFDCPVCGADGSTNLGHRIQIPFRGRGVLNHQATHDKKGQPTRWQIVSGTGTGDLTLSPSVDCTTSNPGCWHGHITNGEIK